MRSSRAPPLAKRARAILIGAARPRIAERSPARRDGDGRHDRGRRGGRAELARRATSSCSRPPLLELRPVPQLEPPRRALRELGSRGRGAAAMTQRRPTAESSPQARGEAARAQRGGSERRNQARPSAYPCSCAASETRRVLAHGAARARAAAASDFLVTLLPQGWARDHRRRGRNRWRLAPHRAPARGSSLALIAPPRWWSASRAARQTRLPVPGLGFAFQP